MSRRLWVWSSYCFEGVHRKAALQRPLLAAPRAHLRRQRRRAHLVWENPHHIRTPPRLLKQTLSSMFVVRGLAWLPGSSGPYRSQSKAPQPPLRTLPVELDELLLSRGWRRLLPTDLEDRLRILGDLYRRGGRHVREHAALEMHHPNAIGELRATVAIPLVCTAKSYWTHRQRETT
jgi:hypothetical protein